MLRACCCCALALYFRSLFVREEGWWSFQVFLGNLVYGDAEFRNGECRKMGEEHTLNDPRNPKTLRMFAKCRYHPKLLAR